MNKDLPFGKCPKCGLSFTAGHKCIEIIEFNKPEANDDLRAIKESVSDLIEREVERRLSEMIPIDTQKVIDDLHAEVERLKETQRKLARFIVLDQERDETCCLTLGKREMMEHKQLESDPAVQAAIKEASDGKA